MNYSTKVLLPVVQQLLCDANRSQILGDLATMVPLPSESLEDNCVTWGGEYNRMTLVNTCSVDNLITALSLHMQILSNSIKLASISISPDLQRIIQMVKSRRFNELRCWIANKISLPLAGSQFDFWDSKESLFN